MTFYRTKDGTRIFYKDWGQGLPIVFLHGWPLSGDAWDAQMLYFGANIRAAALDDVDEFVEELATLYEGVLQRIATTRSTSTAHAAMRIIAQRWP